MASALCADAVDVAGVDALGAAGLSHPSRTFVPMKDGDDPGSERTAPAVGLRVDAVDVAALCDDGLRARLGVLGRAESCLAALKADVLSELARRRGAADAEHAAKEALSVSGRAARSDVKDAVALGELELTRDGLAAGSLPAGHARLIARAAGDAPIDEAFLAERARHEGYDEFRRTVARHVADVSGDDAASLLEQQRRQRSARVFTSRDNNMVVINGQFDPVTGARLASVIAAAERRLYRDEDPACRPTPAQRTADAIAKLICEPDTARPAGTALVVVADYDMVNHQLANTRFADGTPIPIGEIAQIAVDAGVLPAIFQDATGDLRMGRSRRSATELQRTALALRDQGCIGCGTDPDHCRSHHIDHWQHGGPTDYPNLVSVCHDCHHNKIHQQGFTVEPHPTRPGRFALQPPTPTPTPNRSPNPTPGPPPNPSPAYPAPDATPAYPAPDATPGSPKDRSSAPPPEGPPGPPADPSPDPSPAYPAPDATPGSSKDRSPVRPPEGPPGPSPDATPGHPDTAPRAPPT